VPAHDDRYIFEALVLREDAERTELDTLPRKRPAFHAAFEGFYLVYIVEFDPYEVKLLLANPDIIRSRVKVEAAITNARTMLLVQEKYESLDPSL
jgi:DNA-3-methyladenine glycosylase I